MKNLFLSTVFLFTSLMVSPATANATISNATTEVDDFARCEISDPGGFYGKGNCKRVLEAYRAWKTLSKR